MAARARRLAAAAACALALIAAAARRAGAHVGTDPRANNRYLKASLLPDEVRLVYSILYGDLPSLAARRDLDADGDGRISEEEARRGGRDVARAVGRALAVRLDGVAVPLALEPEVGLGRPEVGPWPFSIDLVARVPLAPGRAHRLALRDRYPLADPGETEVIIEEAPGARLRETRLGGERLRDPTRVLLSGAPTPDEDREVEVRFEAVAAEAPRPAPPPASAGARRLALIGALTAVAAAAWLALRRVAARRVAARRAR